MRDFGPDKKIGEHLITSEKTHFLTKMIELLVNANL